MVCLTASRSNTPGRHGITTRVAVPMASVTLADVFAGGAMNTHSTPSALACLTTSAMWRCADLIGRSSASPAAARNLCQRASEPWGSASISRHGRDGLWTCAAIWAVNVLLPEPPLRDAKTMTSIMRPHKCCGCSCILQERSRASILEVSGTQNGSGFLKLEHKVVHRHVRLEAWEIVGVVRIAPEAALGHNAEADSLEFLAQRALLDPVQRAPDGRSLPRQRGVLGHHHKSAGLQRGE